MNTAPRTCLGDELEPEPRVDCAALDSLLNQSAHDCVNAVISYNIIHTTILARDASSMAEIRLDTTKVGDEANESDDGSDSACPCSLCSE